VNDTSVSFGNGAEDWSNVTKGVSTTTNCTIRWKVYANDTSDNWNASDIYSFNTVCFGGDYDDCVWSCPYTVTSNKNVALKIDISSTDHCIKIETTNSLIDCKMGSIIGSRADYKWGIYFENSGSDVIIKNCVIKSFYDGIHFALGSFNNITVINNTITNNKYSGITSGPYSVTNSLIENNTFTDNGAGIRMKGNSMIARNNTLEDNGIGIRIQECSHVIIENNTVKNNNQTGIDVYGAYNFTIRNNIVKGNGFLSFPLYGYHTPGIGVGYTGTTTTSRSNILTDNIVQNNSIGVALGDETYSNTITGGSILDSDITDYYLEDNTGANNDFADTNFTNSRIINITDTVNSFNYNNLSSGGVWLDTYLADSNISRTLTNWNQSLMQWNDTGTSTANYTISGEPSACEGTNIHDCSSYGTSAECQADGCCFWFPIGEGDCRVRGCSGLNNSFCTSCEGCGLSVASGLLPNIWYNVYDHSILSTQLLSDSTGTLSQFSIDLSSEHEIKVEAANCSYSSGDWDIDCSDNCYVILSQDAGGNDIRITGIGTFTTESDIINWGRLTIRGTDNNNRCRVTCKSGGCFKG